MVKDFEHGCERCRGFGKHVCTMADIRCEYREIRRVLCDYRGMLPADVDDMARASVAKTKLVGQENPTMWFDALYFLARRLNVLEKWW